MTLAQTRRCQSVVEVLSDYLDGKIGLLDRTRIRWHLAKCPKCTAYFRQFRSVYSATGRVRTEDLPPDFEQVMADVIHKWKAE